MPGAHIQPTTRLFDSVLASHASKPHRCACRNGHDPDCGLESEGAGGRSTGCGNHFMAEAHP